MELGITARDVITGFSGVITGRATYITGCDQYLIVPKSVDGKQAESAWFDEQRLEIVPDARRIVLINDRTGADKAAPKK